VLTHTGDLDELLLLTVQSVCNLQSIKIPWGEIADTMKNNVTEGAIVQHLAKLRARRIEAKKEVPPPLRRGGGLGTAKGSSKRSKPKGRKLAELSDSEATRELLNDSSDEDYGVKHRCKKYSTSRSSKRAKRDEVFMLSSLGRSHPSS
jgi:hypothetical protein